MGSCFGRGNANEDERQQREREREHLIPDTSKTTLVASNRVDGGTPRPPSTPCPPSTLPSSISLRDKSRWQQERGEHRMVLELISKLNSEGSYSIDGDQLLCLGGRLQKYWFCGSLQGRPGKVLVTVAPLAKGCCLSFEKDKEPLNSLLAKLGKHPLLHPINEIRCHEDKVIVIQPLMEAGSLRDFLHKAIPMLDWDKKYGVEGKNKMKNEDIAKCGKSILEAVEFLYRYGFPPLGHIHTGNIFKTPGGYMLGGYENTALGYRSRFHDMCLEYGGNKIDIIMFGHMIYEMASKGSELTSIVPHDNDYEHVSKDIRRVLKLIFSKAAQDSDYRDSIKEILQDNFFARVQVDTYECDITEKEAAILRKIEEGRERVLQKGGTIEEPDKMKFVDTMNYYLTRRSYNSMTVSALKSIGTRHGKFWGKAVKDDDPLTTQLLSVAKVSKTCPIVLNPGCVSTIREFFRKITHPNLFAVTDLKYYDGYVLLLQPFHATGSLRDLIHQVEPWCDWSEKQESTGQPLKKEQVLKYSKQLLTACSALYQLGFPQLGHIQAGNIFVDGDSLHLGGFENVLLGYSTPNSDKFEQHQGNLDRIMFGHVVFEMGSGSCTESAVPSEADYSKVKDGSVRKFLRKVFADVEAGAATSREWTAELLSSLGGERAADIELQKVEVADKMKGIFSQVSEGRGRRQLSLGQAGATVKKMLHSTLQAFKHK